MTQPKPPATASDAVPDRPGVVVLPPVLILGTLLVGLLIHVACPVPVLRTIWLRIAGASLVGLGAMLARWGRTTMVRAGTNVFPTKPTLAIVTSGPFRFTRNPLYIAASTGYVGLALIFNSAWPLLLFTPMMLMLNWGIVLREERYLEARFGQPYLEYKARVPRWI